MRVMPSEGSGRYSPGPGMVKLLEEMVLPGSTSLDGNLFTQSARYPCYSLIFFHLFVKCGPIDIEDPRGFLPIPVERLERLDDDSFLRLFEGFLEGADSHGQVVSGSAPSRSARPAVRLEDGS